MQQSSLVARCSISTWKYSTHRYQYMEYCIHIELASLCTVLTNCTATGGVSPRTRPPSRSRVGSTGPVQTTGRGNVHKDDDFSIKKDSSWCGIRKRRTCTCLICFFGLRLALCTKQFFWSLTFFVAWLLQTWKQMFHIKGTFSVEKSLFAKAYFPVWNTEYGT